MVIQPIIDASLLGGGGHSFLKHSKDSFAIFQVNKKHLRDTYLYII